MDGFYPYIVDEEGHVIDRVDLVLEKEDGAEHAKRLVDGHDVELWQRDRKIATFKTPAVGPPQLAAYFIQSQVFMSPIVM
jgi:hypothetical protein